MLGFDSAEVVRRTLEQRAVRRIAHRISDDGTCFRPPWPAAGRDLSPSELWHLKKVGPGKGSWE